MRFGLPFRRTAVGGGQRGFIFIISAVERTRWHNLYTILLWWPQTSSDASAAATTTRSLLPTSCWGQPAATELRGVTRSADRLRGLSRAAGWLECAHGTDKAPGEPELSRPMARAAPTPSKGMCALHVCRCAVA